MSGSSDSSGLLFFQGPTCMIRLSSTGCCSKVVTSRLRISLLAGIQNQSFGVYVQPESDFGLPRGAGGRCWSHRLVV